MANIFSPQHTIVKSPSKLSKDELSNQLVKSSIVNRKYPGGTTELGLNSTYTISELKLRYNHYYPKGAPKGYNAPRQRADFVNLIKLIPDEER